MSIKRSCGILLPVSALPSKYGIGTIGKSAFEFVDFLAKANQSWWQILPVGPTGFGDSPYQSFSTFAGNPYFVDLELLCEDGLLEQSALDAIDWGDAADKVDYAKIYSNRFDILRMAADVGIKRDKDEFNRFKNENAAWLCDYALFMSVKKHFDMKAWTEWPDAEIRLHKQEAVKKYSTLLKADVEFFEYIQFLFFRQWNSLLEYAHKNGIGIIGDLPIYVAMDSADVWAAPEFFRLDENNYPTEVAGVPPDYFSEDGQLWGNPLYDYEKMRDDGYGWWIRRIDGASKLYDIIRIDHFRGFESFWAVPADAENAKDGRWIKGPGMDLVGRLTSWFSDVQFIAEDLGLLTPEVRQLLCDSGLPGMKVLEFAFDPRDPSDYLPHSYSSNCVCYVGTHDNTPLKAWFEEATPDEVAFAVRYLGLNSEEGLCKGIIRGGMSSVADLFIAQMQDYLELDAESRMNTPGVSYGNWQWRLTEGQISDDLADEIAETARIYGRSSSVYKP